MVRSMNGLIVKSGDRIKLVGEVPSNPSVGYASDMMRYLNDGHEYCIDSVYDDGDRKAVRLLGWNWDPRNVQKITDIPDIEEQSFLFNTDLLVT